MVPVLPCEHLPDMSCHTLTVLQMLPALPTIVMPVSHYALQHSLESEKVHTNIRYLLKISKCELLGGFHQGYLPF
jgi:hypothetical protein